MSASSAVQGVVTEIQGMFSKSLNTMVKGIRMHKDKSQPEYIEKCLEEIRRVRSP